MLAPTPASIPPTPSPAEAADGGDGTGHVTGASGAVAVPPQASFLSLLETFTANQVGARVM